MTIKVVDLFSGPGGLGEGFSSVDNGSAFSIAVSAEMESSAHSTLVLRAFFRLCSKTGDRKAMAAYYDFCNRASAMHPSWSMQRTSGAHSRQYEAQVLKVAVTI